MEKEYLVLVASQNPVKIEAVRLAFEACFGHVRVEGRSVASQVSDQPMSNEETYRGARNRANSLREQEPNADFWVGVEGGIERSESGYDAFAWMLVLSPHREGKSRTASFALPPAVVDLLNQGVELGSANDIVFNEKNSKQKAGAVGLLTRGLVNRTQLYVQALQLALIPFLHEDLF